MTVEKARSREVSEAGEVGSILRRRHPMGCWEYVLYPVITGKLIKNVFMKIFKMHKYSETNITNTSVSICKSFVIVYQIFLYIRPKVLLRKKRDISSPVLLRGKHYQEFCFYPLGLFFCGFITHIHSFDKYILNVYYVLGRILGTEDTAGNKIVRNLCQCGVFPL